MRRPALVATLLTLCLLLSGSPSPAQQQPLMRPKKADPSVFDEAWEMMGNRYWHRTLKGIDWEAAKARHRPKALRARTQRDVYEAITDLLGELKGSHAMVCPPDIYKKYVDAEAKSIPVPQFGFKLTRIRGQFFAANVLPGGAAAAAGIQRGDRVIAINGKPVHERSLRPVPYDAGLGGYRSFRIAAPRAGAGVRLELEREPRPRNLGLYSVTLTASPWNEVEAGKASMRVYDVAGYKIGYMRLWHVLTEEGVDVLEAYLGRLNAAHGFVLDLRGSGGVPIAITRTLDMFDPNHLGGPRWGKPVVAMIDGGSRSAKEVLAWEWRRRKIGPLVGTTTKGAVLGAMFRKLKDGAYVMVPMMDMRAMTGGVVLEKKGVAPDVTVVDVLPYAMGRDPIREQAIQTCFGEILKRGRVGRKHGWY